MRNNKVECFHLRGLQYLTDRPELVRDRGKIFDQILNNLPPHSRDFSRELGGFYLLLFNNIWYN